MSKRRSFMVRHKQGEQQQQRAADGARAGRLRSMRALRILRWSLHSHISLFVVVLLSLCLVLGDALQSVGVMIAAALIWWKPEWRIADPVRKQTTQEASGDSLLCSLCADVCSAVLLCVCPSAVHFFVQHFGVVHDDSSDSSECGRADGRSAGGNRTRRCGGGAAKRARSHRCETTSTPDFTGEDDGDGLPVVLLCSCLLAPVCVCSLLFAVCCSLQLFTICTSGVCPSASRVCLCICTCVTMPPMCSPPPTRCALRSSTFIIRPFRWRDNTTTSNATTPSYRRSERRDTHRWIESRRKTSPVWESRKSNTTCAHTHESTTRSG